MYQQGPRREAVIQQSMIKFPSVEIPVRTLLKLLILLLTNPNMDLSSREQVEASLDWDLLRTAHCG